MAKWQRKIYLNPEWSATDSEDPKSIQKLAASIALKLKAVEPFGDDNLDSERDELVEEFEALSQDDSVGTEEFDYRLHSHQH